MLKSKLFFSELHSIYLEAFMEIAIAIVLTLKEGVTSPFGEFLAYLLAWFSVLVILVQIPFSYFMLFCHETSVIKEDSKFASSYGTLVEGIRQENTLQRLYFVIVLIRRTIYLFITLQLTFIPSTFQIYLIYFLSLMYLGYNGIVEPLRSRLDRRIELFNETMVGLCLLSLFPMTDWNPEPELKFNYSWLLITLMQILIVTNSAIVFKHSFHSM